MASFVPASGIASLSQDPNPSLGGALEVGDNDIFNTASGSFMRMNDAGTVLIQEGTNSGQLLFDPAGNISLLNGASSSGLSISSANGNAALIEANTGSNLTILGLDGSIQLNELTAGSTLLMSGTTGQVKLLSGATGAFLDLAATGQMTLDTAGSGQPITLATAAAMVDMTGTAALKVPGGTTLEEPAAVNGRIRYDNTTNKWRVVEGGVWVDMIHAAGITAVIDDPSPQLGGFLDLQGNDIRDATGATQLTFQGDFNKALYIQNSGNLLFFDDGGTATSQIEHDAGQAGYSWSGGLGPFGSANVSAAGHVIQYGTAAGSVLARLLADGVVLDGTNNKYLQIPVQTGDPTGVNAQMYYNSTTNKFRVRQNSVWIDMVGGTDELVKVSADDTTAGYLEAKIAAGLAITLTTLNPAADEDLQIAVNESALDLAQLGGILTAAKGGTGQSSYTIGDLLYASGATALSKLAGVAAGNVLLSGGVATAPAWGKVDLTADVSGSLPIANGGTGQTAKTAAFDGLAPPTTKGDVIVHNGTDNIRVAVGSNGQRLVADSAEASGVKWEDPISVTKAKASDESVVSSTVMQDDDDLFVPILSGERCSFKLWILASEVANNPNLDLRMGATAGLTGTICYSITDVTSSSVTLVEDFTTESFVSLTTSKKVIVIEGTVLATADGTLNFQWAQAASDADATVIHACSHMVATKA